MRYSKAALLSTVLTGALLYAAPSPAFEFSPSVTDFGLLRPAAGWRVNAIYIPHGRYCAMATTFSRQISLAFARSPAGYGSLAIDFPGDILRSGKTYSLAMQVDDGQVHAYDVQAVSSRSLIVQIGRDSGFYKALAGNGTLRISLPAMDMRFDLSRFAGSYISLISCADQLHRDDGPRTAAAPVQPVSETALSGASNVAAGQMARAADEAKDRLASARQDETGIGDKIGILQTEKSNLSDRLDMQNRQYKLLQAALQGKEKDLTSALSLSAANSKTLKDVRGELASLRRENDAQIKELQAQLKQKSAQYASLEQKLMLAEAKAKSAQDQETQDEADLAFIRQQLAQTQERLVAVEQEKNRMASQMASTAKDDKTAFQALKLQLSKARAQIAGLESKAAAEQVNISSAAAGTSQGSAPAANMTANPAATTPAMNAEPTPLVAAAPAAEPAAQAAPAKSGISSFFSSLFGHGYGGNNISSSEKSVSPAIVPPSQGENGLSPAPVLNASESGAASATDPMGDWKTVIVQ